MRFVHSIYIKRSWMLFQTFVKFGLGPPDRLLKDRNISYVIQGIRDTKHLFLTENRVPSGSAAWERVIPLAFTKKVHLVLHGKYSSSFIVKCGEDFNSLAYYNVECLSRLHLTQNVEYLGELIGQFLAAFLHSYFPSQVNFWEGSGKVFHYCVFLGQRASQLTLLSVYSLYISLPEREWS